MPGRKFSSTTNYRYGFNGKEEDDEVKGDGNQQDYGMRIYDTRLGRFLSVDPLIKDYPLYSSYQFAGNMPVWAIDLDGAEPTLKDVWQGRGTLPDWFMGLGKGWSKGKGTAYEVVDNFNRNINLVGIVTHGFYSIGTGKDLITGQEKNRLHAFTDMGVNLVMLVAGQKFAQSFVANSTLEIQSVNGAINQNISQQVSSANNGNKILQVGPYKEMAKLNAKSGMSADHIPSFAALKANVESQLGRQLTSFEITELRNTSLTLVYNTRIHQTMSRTYAGRNNATQIIQDMKNLKEAVINDIKALKPSLLKEGFTEEQITNAEKVLIQQINQ